MNHPHPRLLSLFALIATLLLIHLPARAAKMLARVTPQNAAAVGFDVKTKTTDRGLIEFTITRDLSTARSFDETSDLELVRTATLEVHGASGLIARCTLAPDHRPGLAVYRFTLAPEQAQLSSLTITEIDDYKRRLGREHLIGGGTFFEFSLKAFLPQ